MTGIKPRTTTVVIYQGDDLDRLSVLDAAVDRTEIALRMAERAAKNAEGAVRLMGDDNPEAARVIEASAEHDAAVEERDAFAAEAEPRGVRVTLHALPRKDWRTLQDEHPGRPGNDEDVKFGGLNVSTLPEALLPKSIDRSTDGGSTIEGDTGEFLESLCDHDYYERLFMAAVILNKGQALADPTLRLGSVPSPVSAETLS